MIKLKLSILLFFTVTVCVAQVGIGTANPNTSAVLEVKSTTKGFLPPRLTSAERNIIEAPKPGLLIYNTTSNCLEFFEGSLWSNLCTGAQVPPPNTNLTVNTVTYQGESVINNQGIGYNNEAVPAGSTITVLLDNSDASVQNYTLQAQDIDTGLVYATSGTIAANATGVQVVLTHNQAVMPEFESGTITMVLNGASNTINLEPRIDIKSIPASETEIKPVTYGSQTWMDRNLGARRAAETIDDVFSYGNHYQWGRPADGHEISVWNGDTKNTGRGLADATVLEDLSATTTPAHANFILTNAGNFDWLATQNDPDRWASVNQGPCPTGYHVPNNAEWNTAKIAALGSGNGTNGSSSTGLDNNVEAFESLLQIPSAGFRNRTNGTLNTQGTSVRSWSSSVFQVNAISYGFDTGSASNYSSTRALGYTVRCISN